MCRDEREDSIDVILHPSYILSKNYTQRIDLYPSMSSVKKAIKSIKSHIENKEPESAVYEATELLKSLDPKQPEAVQVYVGTTSLSVISTSIPLASV